jgi:hypothetical protein
VVSQFAFPVEVSDLFAYAHCEATTDKHLTEEFDMCKGIFSHTDTD